MKYSRKFHKDKDGYYISYMCPKENSFEIVYLEHYCPIAHYALVELCSDSVVSIFKGYCKVSAWYDKYNNIIVRTEELKPIGTQIK